jgi:heme/copper-type cytochrome/quinol oxidase subunit 3
MTESARTLDVSGLPLTAFDTRTPVWWGNTLFILIETTTIALLVVSYFYEWQYDPQWPPTQSNRGTSTPSTYPGLGLSTLDVLLAIASLAPAAWMDQAAREHDEGRVGRALNALTVIGGVLILLRSLELSSLGFRWDDNTYGSLVWGLLFVHLTYLIAAVLEAATTLIWVLLHGVDEHRAVDVTLLAAYWYWLVGVWVVVYLTVYWAPRVL